jgi:hypothetical protein
MIRLLALLRWLFAPVRVVYAMARYSTPGNSEVWMVTTIASPAAPTAAELNAGTDMTAVLQLLPSIPRTANLVDISDLSDKFEARQVGTRGGDQLQFTVLRDDAGAESELAAVAEDTVGFIAIGRKALATPGTWAIGDEVDVFPVTIASDADGDPGRNDADTAVISAAITANPTRRFSIAA